MIDFWFWTAIVHYRNHWGSSAESAFSTNETFQGETKVAEGGGGVEVPKHTGTSISCT